MTPVNPIGPAIKEHRLALGMTREELAYRSRVSFNTLSQLELGRRKPQRMTVACISRALGCEPEDLTTLGQIENALRDAA